MATRRAFASLYRGLRPTAKFDQPLRGEIDDPLRRESDDPLRGESDDPPRNG